MTKCRLPASAVWMLALIGGLASGPVRAQESPAAASRESVARQLFERGRAKRDQGQCAEAVPLLAASSELVALSGPLLLLADCQERLGRFLTARDTFRRAAELALRDGKSDLAQRNLTRAAALEPRIPHITLSVAGAGPEGLQVSLNGRTLAPSSLNTPMPLDAGPYRLEARAPGYRPLLREFSVNNASAEGTDVQVVPLELERPPFDRRLLASTIGASAVVMAIVTGAVAYVAVKENSEGKGAEAKHLARTWGNVFGVTTGVLAATSLTLFLTAAPAEDTRGLGSVAVRVSGRF